MAIQELRKMPYPLRLAREASSITAFKDLNNSEGDGSTQAVAFCVGIAEFLMPATYRFLRENVGSPHTDDIRPIRNIFLLSASIAADSASNGLIFAAGGIFDPFNSTARRVVLNYATHMGIDFIQHLFGPKTPPILYRGLFVSERWKKSPELAKKKPGVESRQHPTIT